MKIELLIEHEGKLYEPTVEEGITWSTERQGSPGQLTFKVVKDNILNFTEGDPVRLRVDDNDVFFGFVFKKKRDKGDTIEVTAYDQLRYLKNKDTYKIENETASTFIKTLAQDFNLQTGTIDDTGYIIQSRTESNTTLFDMIQNALDLTMQNTKKTYVMYDDFGKIMLRSLENMKLNVLIDEETAENYDYESSIDSNTYNKVKLTYTTDDKAKVSDVYTTKSTENINKWGVLQYFDTLQEGENGQAKADALLSLYNTKTRTLAIKNAFGDVRVRAGSFLPVILNLGDVKVQNYMLVEKCKHEFKESEHFMELTLRGGEFIA